MFEKIKKIFRGEPQTEISPDSLPAVEIERDSDTNIATVAVAAEYKRAGIKIVELERWVENKVAKARIPIVVQIASKNCPVLVVTEKWNERTRAAFNNWIFVLRNENEFVNAQVFIASAYPVPEEILKATKPLLSFEEFLNTAKHSIAAKYQEATIEECNNPVVSDRPCLKIRLGKEKKFKSLGNAYEEYLADPYALENIWERHLDAFSKAGNAELAELLKNFEMAKGRIFPLIKPEGFAMRSNATIATIYSKLDGGLVKMCVIDTDKSMAFVGQDSLDKWKKTKKEIEKIAIDNLENMPLKEMVNYSINSGEKGAPEKGEAKLCQITGNDYVASLILSQKKLREVRRYCGASEETTLVAIPAKTKLILATPKGKIEALQKLVQEIYWKDPHQISNQLFEFDSQGLLKAIDSYGYLHEVEGSIEYEEQGTSKKGKINRLMRVNGKFVAVLVNLDRMAEPKNREKLIEEMKSNAKAAGELGDCKVESLVLVPSDQLKLIKKEVTAAGGNAMALPNSLKEFEDLVTNYCTQLVGMENANARKAEPK